jgi:protein subunit release factor B
VLWLVLKTIKGDMARIILPKLDKDLQKECKFSAYRSSGSGGQHVNVTDSAVRLTHIPTGIVTTSNNERSQYLNKKECLVKLRKKVDKLNYKKPKRIATRVSKSVKRKNKVKNKMKSEKKRLRRSPSQELD